MPFGLLDKDLSLIKNIFQYYSKIEEVVIFGSRAMGTDKPGSDIDLALKGTGISLEDILTISSKLEELPLAYEFDVIDYSTIDNPALTEHIDKHGITFYKKEKIKRDWKTYRLGDIVTLNYGKSLVADKREIGNIPVYSSSGITGWHDKPLVEKKGIIIGRKGTVYYSEKPFYCIDTAYYITSNDDIYDLKFLYYMLTWMNLKKLTSDSAVPGLNRDTVYVQEIFLPDLETQKEIALILSSLDEKIELNQQMNQTLENIAQNIFKEWFVNFNFPDFDGELIDGLPKGWKIGKLGNIIALVYGKALKAENRNEGIYPVIGSSGIVGYHNEYLVKGPGIVIGRKGTIGKVIWINESFFPIDTTFYIHDLLGVMELFYYYFLLLSQDFRKIMSDSAVPGLNRNQAMENHVIIPPNEIIERFNSIVKYIFEKKVLIEQDNNLLDEVKNILLTKILSGKITVRD